MRQRLMLGAAFLALLVAAPARAEMKFAYVDVQRALNDCQAGKKAKAQFRTRVEALQAKLQKEQSEVQRLKDELEKKGMLMKAEQRQSLQDEYLVKVKAFERTYKDSKDELQRKDNEMTGRIVHDLAQIIRGIGEKGGYTMVMEKGSILWGAPGIDLTDQVIRAYDATKVKAGTLGMESGAGGGKAATPAATDFGAKAARRSTISK